MIIGILQVGIASEELVDTYGGYSDMFVELLSNKDCDFGFQTFNVCDNEFPQSINECDGWIITGSKHGVYEDLPWIGQLSDLIVEIYRVKRPLVGICFGHQILSKLNGGRVKQSKYREFGLANIRKKRESILIKNFFNKKNINKVWMSHADQVSKLDQHDSSKLY